MKFDFKNYKGNYVMHCKTKEEAIEFCELMSKIGRKWSTGAPYSNNNYNEYKSDTCYNFNEGMFGDVDYYRYEVRYIILEWSDFSNDNSEIKTERKEEIKMEKEKMEFGVPKIINVRFNDTATIVFWEDGTKTVVKAHNETIDHEKGLSMAITKKALGNNMKYYDYFSRWLKKGEARSKSK